MRAFITWPTLVIAIGFAMSMGMISAMSTHTPTKGPIPNSAFLASGGIDASVVPDFIPAYGRDGETIAGYVPKEFVLGTAETTLTTDRRVESDWPIFASDLKTLVGYMVPDKGFVPLGVDAETIPRIPAEVSSE
jgi:hypothetical protein